MGQIDNSTKQNKKNYKNKNLLFSTGGADKYELIKKLPFFKTSREFLIFIV